MSISAVLPHPGIRLGLSGSLVISLGAALLAAMPAFGALGLGWLPLALALGIAVGNLWPALAERGRAGLGMARGPVMRSGIALYGLQIGVHEFIGVGWAGPLMALVVVASTLLLALLGGRLLGVERHCALLVGAGSAICGAAAVAAADGVIGARSRDVSAAVAVVVIFGTVSMYLLPLLYPLLHLSEPAFGLWVGLAVHELGHVVAAAGAVGQQAAAGAVMEKMLRVLLLGPAVVWIALREGRSAGQSRRNLRLPLFLWGFFAAVAISWTGTLPAGLHSAGVHLGQGLLAVGMAALGATTRLGDVRQAGWRVWLLAGLLWLYLLGCGLGLVCGLAPDA
jgi:uncharacterized integral membrane protein (TIGR00698 family)